MPKYTDVLIVLCLIIQNSGQKLLPEMETTFPISKCIVHILNRYFTNSTQISIKNLNGHNSIVSDILKNIDIPILINAGEISETQKIDKRIPDRLRIMIGESTDIFQFLNESKWTATTQFLAITTNPRTSEEKMIDIFRQFWANNIVNVLLLVADKHEVRIYTFIPFNPHDCAIHKPVLVATFTSGQITTQQEVIPKERVTNLNGCTLNASVMDIPQVIIFPNAESKNGTDTILGIEGSILIKISKRLNFKLNMAQPKDGKAWGRLRPTPHGAVGEVFYKKTHFASGNLASTIPRYNNLDVSVPVCCGMECMSWAVPIGAKKAQPVWVSLLITGFSNNVWYLIIATSIFTTAIYRILSKTSIIDRDLFNGNIKTIIYIFRSSLGPSARVPKSSFLRTLFLFWLWYSFVISTAYQALMGSKLTVPYKQHNIITFKDLLDTDLHITGKLNTFKLVIEGNEDEDIKAIEERFVGSNFNFITAIEKIISGRNLGYMWSSTTFMYNVELHPKAEGLVHVMKQCAYKFYPTMLLQKNSPLTPRVNRIIRALYEGGIICKWRKQYVYEVPQPEPKVQKLTLNRMTGSFVLLGAGLGTSFIIFVAEHIIFWCSSRKTIKKVVARIKQNIIRCDFDISIIPRLIMYIPATLRLAPRLLTRKKQF